MIKKWEDFYRGDYSLNYLMQNITCHLEMFKSICKEKPVKVLEVGTGTGSMPIFLSYLGFSVTSLDKSNEVLKKAEELAGKLNGKVKFVLGDAFKLPFPDDSFDLIFHQGLLEHFNDEDILKLLAEQLRVGKKVVLSVPNNFYPEKDLGNERLLPKKYWDKILKEKFKLLQSCEYNPFTKTLFGGRLIYKVRNTMYLAKIG